MASEHPKPDSELKPCPFCASEAVLKTEATMTTAKVWCECTYCFAKLPWLNSEDKAKALWNQRLAEPVAQTETPSRERMAMLAELAALRMRDQCANWLRQNANAETDLVKRAIFIEAHNAILKQEYRPIELPPASPPTGAGWHDAAQFLIDRLDEYDPGDSESERDYHGHVAPALARLKTALANSQEERGQK